MLPTRCSAFLLATLVLPQLAAQESRPSSLRIVALEGTPYARGLAHGKALRQEIAAMLVPFRADLAQATGCAPELAVSRFLAATAYEPAISRFTPGLLDEVRGIADGAGQSYEDLLAYQLPDEIWAQGRLLFAHKCTTIGVDRDGERPAFVAQNMDLPAWMHAHPTVLRIRHPDRDLESLVVTLPGLIGGNGLNNRRIAVGVNTVLQIRATTAGLPVAFVVRGLLEQATHADALAFLQRVQHASGQAYTVGGPDTAPCFECSAGKVVPYVPFAGARRTWHTNHPLVNDDWSQLFRNAAARKGQQPAELPLRCDRFDAVARALGPGQQVGLDEVLAVLRAREHNVCNAQTYVCTVMLLGAEPELRIGIGSAPVERFPSLGVARPAPTAATPPESRATRPAGR